MLQSGFFGDDAFNSVLSSRSTVSAQGQSLGQFLVHSAIASMGGGRIFPLSVLTGISFYAADGRVFGFKLVIFALLLLNLALFGHLIRRLTNSWQLGSIAIALAPLTLQFRSATYHDPILAFGGLLPIVTGLTFASLILLVAYLRADRRRYLVSSLALYACALLTYEIALTFCVLHLLVIWLYPNRRGVLEAVRKAVPFFALAAGMVVVTLALRASIGMHVVGSAEQYAETQSEVGEPAVGAYVMNISPRPVAATLVRQVVASFPLAAETLDTQERALFFGPKKSLADNAALAVVLFAGYGYLAFAAFGRRRGVPGEPESSGTRNLWPLVVLGAGLLVVPNVLISLSPRYQTEVHWGSAYLPVYVSCFGMTLMGLAAIVAMARSKWASRSRLISGAIAVVLVGGIAGVAVVNYQNNVLDVADTNRHWKYPRMVESAALERGLIAGLPEDSALLVNGAMSWDTADFVRQYSGKELSAVGGAANAAAVLKAADIEIGATQASVSTNLDASDVYYLSYGSSSASDGYAVLGRVRSVEPQADGSVLGAVDAMYVYVSTSARLDVSGGLPKSVQARSMTGGSPVDAVLDASVTKQVVDSGPTWVLYRVDPGYRITVGL